MLKVIGSGFGRTGTLSLKMALEEIGYGPCYHMQEVIKRPSHIKLWHQMANGQRVDLHQIFADFQATVDFPANVIYKELMALYPEAKVIHTIRDPERWYESTYETIYPARFVFPDWLLRGVPFLRRFMEMQDGMFWETLFEGQFENRHRALEIFDEYTEDVKRTVPAEKLLIFNVAEGWQPLCQFLDVPIPDTPFPHVNDKATMQRRLQILNIVTRSAPPLLAGLVVLLLYQWLRQRHTP